MHLFKIHVFCIVFFVVLRVFKGNHVFVPEWPWHTLSVRFARGALRALNPKGQYSVDSSFVKQICCVDVP